MAEPNELFNSKSRPIPGVRREISFVPVNQNGDSYLYVHDMMGYVPDDLALNAQVQTLLSLFDGRKSVEDLKPFLGEDVTTGHLLEFVQFLDENRILNSAFLDGYREKVESGYESSETHESVTAGGSYPADPETLRALLEDAFEEHDGDSRDGGPVRALYAPHIDPRVSLDIYAGAFSRIADQRPRRVVMLATSHYAGLYPEHYENRPYILVNKDFKMPNGLVQADREALDRLAEAGEELGVTAGDRAHRMEHSIELHLVFLNHLWKHDYEIVPILVNGFDELYYNEQGFLGESVSGFSEMLREEFAGDEDTLFLVSGDLAHVGKKFGDDRPADNMFDEIRSFDARFLDHAVENRRGDMLAHMKEEFDPYRICGFPPLYTLMHTLPDLRGELINYEIWDEQERESAVSFGSIAYR